MDILLVFMLFYYSQKYGPTEKYNIEKIKKSQLAFQSDHICVNMFENNV